MPTDMQCLEAMAKLIRLNVVMVKASFHIYEALWMACLARHRLALTADVVGLESADIIYLDDHRRKA